MRPTMVVLAMLVAGAVAFLVGLAIGFGEADAQAPGKETAVTYAKQRGCAVTYPSKRSYRQIKRMLRHHYPLKPIQRRRSKHYAVCVETRAKSKAVWDYRRRSMKWRRAYEHRWPITFHGFPSWAQNWAWSTGACESGNNPRAYNPSPFYGAFQFVLSTWYAAGGTGNPMDHSWWYQAVIAVRLMYREGAGHWPICGH